MKLRIHVGVWGQLLFTAIGIVPIASCGGSVAGNGGGGTGGTGGSQGTGGVAGSGGSTGGAAGMGGSGGIGGIGGAGGNTVFFCGDGLCTPSIGESPENCPADCIGETGGAAGAAGSAGQGGMAGYDVNSYPCTNPTPVVDATSGFEHCSAGFNHRPKKTSCPSKLPRAVVYPVVDGGFQQCTRDTDCTMSPHGYCANPSPGGGPYVPGATYCGYGCVVDEECPLGNICECSDPVGRCVPSTCESDATCNGAQLCTSYTPNPGCPSTAYSCQTTQDNCGGDADCKDPSKCPYPSGNCGNMQCSQANGAHVCEPALCAIGRPFLVDGRERLAPARARADWQGEGLALRVAMRTDAALAAAWTQVALMEHASIAAFARFTLQLLALGAPAELVELSNAALADETKHAKICFAIASAYGGGPVGPGALAIQRSLDASSLEEIVVTTLREGCIGETIAALEAAEAREHAVDPAIREALATIAEDETRHAQLAWRFVRWALSQGDERLRNVIAAEFDAQIRSIGAPRELDAADRRLLDGGIVPDALRALIRAEAMARVILPGARALLGEGSAPEGSRDMAA